MGVKNPVTLYAKFTRKLVHALEKVFYRIGEINYDYPHFVIPISVAFALACAVGFLNINFVSEAEKLWIPQSSTAISYKKQYEAAYGPESGVLLLLITAKDEGSNLFTNEAIQEIFDMHQAVFDVAGDDAGSEATYQELCQKFVPGFPVCNYNGFLGYWGYNRTIFQQSWIDQTAGTLASAPTVLTSLGSTVVRGNILAGATVNAAGDTTGLTAIKMVYIGASGDNEGQAAWEKAILAEIEKKEENDEFQHITVYRFASRSIDDELGAAVGGDIIFFAIAFILMLVYTTLAISKYTWVRSRFWLSNAALGTAVLAILSSFGLSSAMGLIFSSITQILPFILVGIGIDDMFVIVDSYDTTSRTLPLRERFATSMARSGVSITVTSITNAVAFFLGSSTNLPAIRAFCIFAALGVIFDFLYSISFLSSIIALDAKRVHAKRADILPCIKCDAADSDDEDEDPKGVSQVHLLVHSSILRHWIERYYTPFLLKLPVRIGVIVLVLLLAGFSAFSITDIDQGLPLTDLTPDVSYVRDYLNRDDSYFGGQQQDLWQVIDDPDFDFASPQNQDTIEELTALMAESDAIVEGSTVSWLRSYLGWLPTSNITQYGALLNNGRPANEQDFYEFLQVFLSDPLYNQLGSDLKFSNGRIATSRITLRQTGANDEVKRIELLREDRDMQKDFEDRIPGLFIFASNHIFSDGDLALVTEAVLNFVLALVAVFVITMVLLVHPVAALIVTFCIAIVDLLLFGLMWVTATRFNTISVTNLVMAIGLAFDYVGHIAHAFVDSKAGNRLKRVEEALSRLGISVVNGGVSTLLGVLVLGFSSSTIFRTFFLMFVGIVGFGLLVGFAFLPAVLSFVGPNLDDFKDETVDLDDLKSPK